ncbi:type I-C CRISPR-associated protein Cas8c/Csd1 [Zymomonas mobilis]|uniref:CRISPR-associated protein, Csd1 family n=2 Tax=Zymomonas mobilis TaxID=542 RepID=F8EWF8_ZYMMT|nr:type I-C CRISPR-associated protein Cas8c/Csd1 [Zymomonas mobilis]AEI38601.1 CRISPR-associated protein, Csd1 family [Zymomonas mobilis subsp. pomaceae ATCC 29192]MDX5949518.1 type I-C CRISPR-associated protein Cas8c/Csd1 [Zymomonas mobilis subsp. pomaceae]GEB90009.1 type I-C CRISPR-associated protein Cas8c/Csd1 [Zymomonas mobilis subsp. pomaceae]
MSVIASLVEAYKRFPDTPPFGYSAEQISYVISLNDDGTVAHVVDLRVEDGKKRIPRKMFVPHSVKRAANITSNFLWDKTSYVLGITAKEAKRTEDEHRAFVEKHINAIGDSTDAGLRAFRLFLEGWRPEYFTGPVWLDEMKDQNVVFALESNRLKNIYLHDSDAAKLLWSRIFSEDEKKNDICLVTGEAGNIVRLHPSIKGVWGAQSSGATLISFNLESFTSYGHKQGRNAPTSEAAVFAYTTMLNYFLDRGSHHRLQIGDASTVFWADAGDKQAAEDAESLFYTSIDIDDLHQKEEISTNRLRETLARLRRGEPIELVEPELAKGVHFYILGLAPNAARLSVRFFYSDNFCDLIRNYQRFVSDMRIEPPPREEYPPLSRYLLETAVLGKRENIVPNLAGEWFRSILTGSSYPLTLMSSVIRRIRADGQVNGLRVGILKALLVRNFNRKDVPVALDPDNINKGYLLGRLFAVYEQIQTAALGSKVNATIKDKFYGSASAQPRKVFPVLDKGSANHLSKIGKEKPGFRIVLEKTVASIMEKMRPDADPFPTSLAAQDQALFGLGYYHQRSEFFKKANNTAISEE